MKILCDQMLAKLGKWLRAAGYDTLIIDRPLTDQEILELAQREKRIVISRDRFFAEVDGAIWLKSNALNDCVKELKSKLGINWLLNPFSRCIDCNSELTAPEPSELDKIPEGVKARINEFWFCPRCQKVFWRGTHTDHMGQILKR